MKVSDITCKQLANILCVVAVDIQGRWLSDYMNGFIGLLTNILQSTAQQLDSLDNKTRIR